MPHAESLERIFVFMPREGRKATLKDGTPAPPRRIGRVHHLVFSPDGLSVVGVLVQRPDVAGMVKREDIFCAWDRLRPAERGILVEGEAATDAAAIARLGLDWDRCIIWAGMDVATESGKPLGVVSDVSFDDEGAVDTILVSEGGWSESMVGSVPITRELLKGVANQVMVVDEACADLELTGGFMAKAGEAYGKAKLKGREVAAKAGSAASEAVDKGSFALGRAIGSARDAISDALADDDAEPVAPVVPTPAASAPDAAPAASATDAAPSVAPTDAAPAAEPAPAQGTGSMLDDAALAIGKQLGKTKGMWAAFLREYKENSQ